MTATDDNICYIVIFPLYTYLAAAGSSTTTKSRSSERLLPVEAAPACPRYLEKVGEPLSLAGGKPRQEQQNHKLHLLMEKHLTEYVFTV